MDDIDMKFLSSITVPTAIQASLHNITINSMAKFAPEEAIEFDGFLKKLDNFHAPAVEGQLAELVTNYNQPIFDFNDIKAQYTQHLDNLEIAEAMQVDQEISL